MDIVVGQVSSEYPPRCRSSLPSILQAIDPVLCLPRRDFDRAAHCKFLDNTSSLSPTVLTTMSTARNPVLPGFNPDPSIVRVGSDYFCTTSSFEYFPGLPIYHSTDLVNWTLIGHALNRISQLHMRTVEPGGGVYAPSIRYWKGRFYVSTCVLYLRSRVSPLSAPLSGLLLRFRSHPCRILEDSTYQPRTFGTMMLGLIQPISTWPGSTRM